MGESKKKRFNVTKVTRLSELAEKFNSGEEAFIEESDLTLQDDSYIVQLDMEKEDKQKRDKYKINPGIFNVASSSAGLFLTELEFKQQDLLKTNDNTEKILAEVDKFFSNLGAYKKYNIDPKRALLMHGPPGCHAKGTEILLHNGDVKKVEDVLVGDLLMGPDSKPREVLKLARNREQMVRINPTKGDSFVVNMGHIMHLTPSGDHRTTCPINITVKDFLKQTKCFQERYKLTRTGVDFSNKEVMIDPYILGLWLGDGNSKDIGLTTADPEIENIWRNYGNKFNMDIRENKKRIDSPCKTLTFSSEEKTKGKNILLNIFKDYNLINNKHVPKDFLVNCADTRLKLLAGLIDSDGTKDSNSSASITQKSEKLTDDILFLCRSLGLAAYKKEIKKACTYKGEKREGTYYRVSISGDLSNMPTVLERKRYGNRSQIKNVLRTGFSVELLEEDNYYGFTLDEDHLYLTKDFTIHHNTGKTSSITEACNDLIKKDKGTVVINWNASSIRSSDVLDFFTSGSEYTKECSRVVFVIEDIGMNVEGYGGPKEVDRSLLNFLDGSGVAFRIPTFIMATTNYVQNLPQNLIDRPGRFDKILEVGYPDADSRVALMEFITKAELSEDDKKIIRSKDCDTFSTAYLKEIFIRSQLDGTSIVEVVAQLKNHQKRLENDFDDSPPMGMGML